MTISNAQRTDDKTTTLLALFRRVGEEDIRGVAVSQTNPELAATLATTWRELLDDAMLDNEWSTMGGDAYRLTPAGWLRAAMLLNLPDDPSFRERCVILVRALKATVKGRSSARGEIVSISALATQTSLPDGWIFNVLRSRLLRTVFPRDRWDARVDSNVVWVAPTFGMNVIDEELG